MPPVVWALCAAFVGAYAYFVWGADEGLKNALYGAFAVIPARYNPASPLHFEHWWEMAGPLVGHVFLHGSWLHVGANTFFFFLGARFVALRLGTWRFLVLFFASAILGALFFLALHWGQEGGAVGASGGVCGVFAGYFLSARRTWREAFADPAIRNAMGSFLFINVAVMGLASTFGGLPIAWEAHLGGFIGGALAYLALSKPAWAKGPWG